MVVVTLVFSVTFVFYVPMIGYIPTWIYSIICNYQFHISMWSG